MTTLGDWAQQHILGASWGDTSWRSVLGELRERLGSGRAVARATGVNESTIRRLLSGKTRAPKPATAGALRAAVVAEAARDPRAVTLHTTDRDSGRERTLTDANLRLRPGTMDRVVATWISTGDKEAAGAVFLAGVSVPFYQAYLKPREGELVPVDEDEVDEDGDYYLDDDGQAYQPEEDDLPYYDDFDVAAEEVFGPDSDSYGGDVAA